MAYLGRLVPYSTFLLAKSCRCACRSSLGRRGFAHFGTESMHFPDSAMQNQSKMHESAFSRVDELVKLRQFETALQILKELKPSGMALVESNRLSRLIHIFSELKMHSEVLETCALLDSRGSRLPNSILFAKGSAHLGLGQAQDAVVSFTLLIDSVRRRDFASDEEFQTLLASSCVSRGLAYMKLGDFEMMLKDMDRSLQFQALMETRYLRATALANLRRFSEALQEFDQLLETDSRNVSYLLGRCLMLSQLGRPADAFFAVCDAISTNPDNLALPLLKGRIELRNRFDFMGAFQTFLQVRDRIVSAPHLSAEEKRDMFARSTFGMASSVMCLQGFNRAIHLLQDGLQFEPENVVAFSNLAYCYLVTNEPEKTLETCDRGLQIDPKYPDLHQNRASALAALNRLEESQQAHEHATSLRSQNPTTWSEFLDSFKRA